ncbi:protein kinase domain-containing protein [Niallia sp. MER TA 168]|uniref:protein kinase domain-containing protein n=1 Tax=Niallia sp. MER TA 168 TaxID=2939568 RepID=UPI002041D8E0|nr:serine/threonine-protein kinase [Niallia sp. MER TA 168]MCM3363635.1 serine/threonine-protein kinase [Niallia sp. MER TA 168]
MMMNTSKSPFKINGGTVVKGKWHNKQYTILKELGYGANGTVFLADSRIGKVALKLSNNSVSITSEVNVLKSFAKVQGYSLGPSLIDVDDWVTNKGNISFYVMEYINGPDLLAFIHNKEGSWIDVLMIQLLKDLQVLHENNWVFGDLKPENLIITGPPTKIRCIDVGGTTIIGRAIKEFTEFFDRGYWGLGTRKAEPSYDLFAVAMIMLNIYYPKRFNKTEGGIKQLQTMIRQKKGLLRYEGILIKALTGKYQSAKEMRFDLLKLTNGGNTSRRKVVAGSQANISRQVKGQNLQTSNTRSKMVKKKKKAGWIESMLIIILISICYILYIYGQLT